MLTIRALELVSIHFHIFQVKTIAIYVQHNARGRLRVERMNATHIHTFILC